jgi:DNA mismatch endonuclease (patch repair protein)
MDVLTPEQRSRNMAAIRARGNRTTEQALRYRLVRAGIGGWTLHSARLPGRPDFVFRRRRLVIFVDGCYWHGCPKCYRPPETNTGYWSEKFKRNKSRDRRVTAALRRSGWRVLRVWEHEVEKSPDKVVEKIKVLLTALG